MSSRETQPLLPSTTTPDIREDEFIIPTPLGPTNFDLRFLSFAVATTGVILFAGTLGWIVFQADSSLFLLHPICMSLTLVFVTEGAYTMQEHAEIIMS